MPFYDIPELPLEPPEVEEEIPRCPVCGAETDTFRNDLPEAERCEILEGITEKTNRRNLWN